MAPTRNVILTPGKIEQVLAMREQGLLLREIAVEVGVCRASVGSCLRKAGKGPPLKKLRVVAAPAAQEKRQPLPAGHPVTWGLIMPGYAFMGGGF